MKRIERIKRIKIFNINIRDLFLGYILLWFFTIMVDVLLKTKFLFSINFTIARDIILMLIIALLFLSKKIPIVEKLTLVSGGITILLLDYFIIILKKNGVILVHSYLSFPIYHFLFSFLFLGSYWQVKTETNTYFKKFNILVCLAFGIWFMIIIFKISYVLFLSSLITLFFFLIENFKIGKK